MEYKFICKICGTLNNYNPNIGTINFKCAECNTELNWNNAFPPQTAIDFFHTVNSLYELSKNRDKENLEFQFELVKKEVTIDKTTLDKYINEYESILCKNTYNDDSKWQFIDDQFIEALEKEMNYESALKLYAAIRTSSRNEYRKPCYIMIATLIEQLFHDYFDELLNFNLSENGKKIFLKKYEYSGIQSVIEISESFIEEGLQTKTNRYINGFFDKWSLLRTKRNNIIHSNNIYISKIELSKAMKLLNESFTVFENLKSELYKENTT